ncbi:uncharacterized protein APUU_21935A [Aspergillus puulaauensis]|uniref:Uncharacterized protein n=1 Tax=Aspergillus puulaauensis TaxID=1220207 RepID=A0A7R8ALG6_9EURO|nr:uncharacterized protein APUU_21935A [Aspergillus puulaauensis]BCS21503.1 hypothetical protein APUU_21935A [Aspergillus puulaauensis]
MQTSFSAYPGKQNNNTGEGPQFNDTKFYGPVNIHYPQPQGHHGAPEGTVQMAYESLEKRFGNPLTATPHCLRRAAQALVRQKMASDAKEHAQLIATTLQGEVRRFLLLPAPGPDHFTQLGPAFGELEERQGLLLNSHQLHIILGKSVVRVLSNTQKRPPLHSTLVRVSFLGLCLSLHLLAGREDPLQSIQRVYDTGRRELDKGISRWLFIQFVYDVGQYLVEQLQYRDTAKLPSAGLRYSNGLSIDEMRHSMLSAARVSSPSDGCRRMALLLPGTMPSTESNPSKVPILPETLNSNVQPGYGYESEIGSILSAPQSVAVTIPTAPTTPPASRRDEIDSYPLSPTHVKYSMREPGKVLEDEGDWKDRSTKPAARALQLVPALVPDASVMKNEPFRISIDEKVRQILMAELLNPLRIPGTVCLTPAHTREGSYKIYYLRENAASSSKQCYRKQDPLFQIQCRNIISIKKLVLAEFTGQTKTLECNMCGKNHNDWIAAPDMDIKNSLRAWTKLLETEFESSRVPRSDFSRDGHRWRKWASETAELRVVNEPRDKDPPSNVEECERSMDLQARGLKSSGGGLYGLLSIAEIQFLCWYTLWMCLCMFMRFLSRWMVKIR